MDGFSWSLLLAAAGVALTHTLLGPDHYLPFIMLARARRWSARRTAVVTSACGLGHVLSSVALGGLGVAFGVAIASLERLEGGRGSLAAWALIAFGAAYATWGVRKGMRRTTGLAAHAHAGHFHVHRHGNVPHRHDSARGSRVTFWTLLTVFILGPCEPLIPLFVLPASRGRWDLAVLASVVFGIVTVGTMVAVVALGAEGLGRLRVRSMQRWSHAVAGGIIAVSGLAVLFLGL